jgi:hypothetical protein
MKQVVDIRKYVYCNSHYNTCSAFLRLSIDASVST